MLTRMLIFRLIPPTALGITSTKAQPLPLRLYRQRLNDVGSGSKQYPDSSDRLRLSHTVKLPMLPPTSTTRMGFFSMSGRMS